MTTLRRNISGLLLVLILAAGCVKNSPQPTIPAMPELPPVAGGNGSAMITVDCAVPQGDVMRFEQSNVHSTTSNLPGENARTWLQSLNHKTIRTWLALSTINSKGYNYKYSSDVPTETSLAYYSTCADSLLIALTAYKSSPSTPLPGDGKGSLFQNFIKQTIIYYKNKFPKIKYIQAGNEPDYAGETAVSYYEVYKDYYKAINAANAELGLAGNSRLMLSNGAFTSTTNFSALVDYTNQFLALYAADTDPGKRLDFFSMNCYTEQSNPKLFETAKPQIIAALAAKGISAKPVFVTEYGLSGGDFLPAAWVRAQLMTAWAPAQLAKAFYLYEGGVDRVFNWAISHGEILHKSELADLNNAYPNPYGYALMFGKQISDRGTRIKATSTKLSAQGLGINALAATGNGKGIAVLVWNFNYTNFTPDQEISVKINNIPQTAFTGKINTKIYMIDSKNNNIYTNPSQNSLTVSSEQTYDYAASLSVPLKLEGNSVALIVLNP
ncbi:hypothetical protein ABIE26_000279 [Pedobacter africanus]|uniref:Uncharacterized protein n=1 Tax=Pedobacter africanus TaxID=151894 RepID=A0ACC6KVS5_9SPHI|nr:hypothetical protein [Pedobacter africanus]MDR6783233.1 hypothetical protein [Pedobacter africanus]